MEKWDAELTITPKDIKENLVFHIEQDGKIVGFYALSDEGDRLFEIEHMWILPAYMGKGFGKMLFQHAREIASQNGGNELRVESDPHAEGFYLKMGMKRIGEKESSIPGRKLPILEMELEQTN